MKMEETSRPSFLFGISVAAIFVLSLVLTCCSAFESSSLLVTIPILFLSTIFAFTFSKKKVVSGENQVQESSPEDKLEKEAKEKVTSEVETVFQCQESETVCVVDEYQVESTDFPSDSESSSADDFLAGESFELNWIHSNSNVVQNVTAISESSISDDEEEEEDDDDDDDDDDDEDSLIEINLPNDDSTCANEDSKQKFPDFLPDSIFKQEGLEELLAEIDEVNEEENLIEIDLSMGSIKCPSFEIET